eukprot:CAMPEP_0174349388 /NCGR_PEP_ID=MMETSP0811_2-20130205/6118_1 /TAXON_ID=73025 ORGANISM="Eutreptiella gymnastica-like, Strain CCMP1594" /NCGR_SAMPLE_ID=MMETSP0811_2 /ASSEMBLY_ACC=CAM_ASM_000667 /LENGTH=104 /DNA_ID=CAMNT_0015476737 /DNA_START=104 /DNA_END=416 /DNA_ORIENTATION=+
MTHAKSSKIAHCREPLWQGKNGHEMRRLGLHTGSGFGEETVHIVCPQTVPPSSSSVSWGGGRQSDRRGNTPSPDQTDKEFSLPDQAPWPRAVFGTTTLPLAAVH